MPPSKYFMILFYDVISKSVTGIKMPPTLGEEFFAESERESTLFCCSICEVTRFNRRQNWIIKWKKESIIKEKKIFAKTRVTFSGISS